MNKISYLINLDWSALYIGLLKNWLTIQDCEKIVFEHFMPKYESDIISLSIVNDDTDKYKYILKEITTQYAFKYNISLDSLLDIAIRQWYLANILQIWKGTDLTTWEKLRKIEIVWVF